MEFLYPEFNTPTHKIIINDIASLEYPNSNLYLKNKDFNIQQNALVSCIRENIGYNCEWTLIKIIDNSLQAAEYFNKEVYIPSINLESISSKQSYAPICNKLNSIDEKAEDINPLLMETFIPYIDKKNGFYSVRVQIGYDRILDMGLFKKVLDEVYYEGVSILLASRGYKSDNQSITALKNKYHTFAYVHNDLDLTVRRICEPLTFTVSIPLNFFNVDMPTASGIVIPAQTITFTNLNFLDKIDSLLTLFSSRAEAIRKATFPDKIIENFVLTFELNAIKNFAIAANELMAIPNCPISATERFTEYTIGLDPQFNLVSCYIKKETTDGYQEINFNQGLISMCRLRADFNNKRIFNYLINIDSMISDIVAMNIIEFLKKYVIFPNVRLVEESVTINGIDIPPEKLKEYRIEFSKNSEACLKISDIKNLAGAITDTVAFSDPIFHLLGLYDPKNEEVYTPTIKKIGDNFNSIKNYFDSKPQEQREQFKIQLDIIDSATEGMESYSNAPASKKVMSSLNTLAYILKRIDIQQVLFTRILCLLKGTDPNATETAQLLSEIPYEVINYINYLQMIQNLKGAAYIKALEEGISFDMALFCNDEVVYFIKNLTKLIQSVNTGISAYLTFIKEYDASLDSRLAGAGSLSSSSIQNPYQAIINSVANTTFSIIKEFLFEWARDLLTEECDDPIFDNDINNFSDPYNTHYPNDRYGNQENNNPQVIKSNRLKAIKNTVPDIVRELQFGADIEYTVDLIGLLINDIRCILTPKESVSLLQGTPSQEVIILIKNIIRNKYSKDPNNLSYLLNNDKLTLLFKNIGLTIDPQVIETIQNIVTVNQTGDVCTPEQKELRSQIINKKLPPELGILEKDSRRRVKKARELLEKIKGGETVYYISALCPETEDADILKLKDKMIGDYTDSIRSIFSNTLTSFTNEAAGISKNFIEEQQIIRQEKGIKFDNFVYNTYYYNLSHNLKNLKVIEETKEKYKLLYQNLTDDALDISELRSLYLKKEEFNTNLIYDCDDREGVFTLDNLFKKYLEEGRIGVQFEILDKAYEDSERVPLRGGVDATQELLNKQEYYVYIKIINYYDEQPEVLDITLSYRYASTGSTLVETPILKIKSNDTEFDKKNKFNTKKRILNNLLKYNKSKNKNILKVDLLNIIDSAEYDQPAETLSLLQATLKNAHDAAFGRLQAYQFVVESKEKYNQNGLFNIIFIYNKDYLEKSINIPYGSPASKIIEYKELYKIKYPFSVTQEDKSILTGLYKTIFKSINENLSENLIVEEIQSTDSTPNGISVVDLNKTNLNHLYFKSINAGIEEDLYKLSREITVLDEQGKAAGYDLGNALQFHSSKSAFQTDIHNRNYQLIRNQGYKDPYIQNYSKLSKLDLNNDIRYKNCNIYPHYLNLDYFLNSAAITAKEEMCDTNLSNIPKIILEEVLVNLTIRAYITDFMSKLAPFLSLLDKEDLLNLYKEQIVVDILREQLKQEMHLFTSNIKIGEPGDYFIEYSKLIDSFLSRPENSNKKKQKLFLDTSEEQNKNIDYFIRKEIKHFIEFSIEKGLFTHRPTSVYKLITYKNASQDLIKIEFYSFIMYMLTANAFDFEKRSLFVNTKGELFKVFFKTINLTSEETGERVYEEKKQEDIVKFLNSLIFSGNPAAMLYTNPDYSKYIKFFIDAIRRESKRFFLRDALRTNFNIFLTKAINTGLAAAGAIAWSLIEPEERNKMLIRESVNNRFIAHMYKRFENGMSPIPDLGTSTLISAASGFTNWPNDTGWAYLALDTLDEYDFHVNANKELDELAKYALQDKNPCEVEEADLKTDLSCSENKEQLINELDKFE